MSIKIWNLFVGHFPEEMAVLWFFIVYHSKGAGYLGIRPCLSPRSRRLIIPLGETGAMALRAEVEVRNTTVRWFVLQALLAAGIVEWPGGVVDARWRGSCNGAGRKRVKSSGYEISVDLPDAAIEQLREVVQRTGKSAVYLVHVALQGQGIPIALEELAIDRRKRGWRTPRQHYAHGVRAGRGKRLVHP